MGDSLFPTTSWKCSSAGATGHPHANTRTHSGPFAFHKNEFKLDHRSTGKCKTVKLGDNIRENLDDLGYCDDFLDTSSKNEGNNQ